MTAQFPHNLHFDGADYVIAGLSAGPLFHPSEIGLEPVFGRSTACWEGFLPSYRIDKGELYLDRLSIYLRGDPPVIAGIAPITPDPLAGGFDATYEHLSHRLIYSGGILGGRRFIDQLYVHMGFHPAWKYREVHEFIFEDGSLIDHGDRSDALAEFRERLLLYTPSWDVLDGRAAQTKLEPWIKQCFSLDYKWWDS